MKLRLDELYVPSDNIPCDDWHHAYWTRVSLWGNRYVSVAECRVCGATWSWRRGRGQFPVGPVAVQFTVRRAA